MISVCIVTKKIDSKFEDIFRQFAILGKQYNILFVRGLLSEYNIYHKKFNKLFIYDEFSDVYVEHNSNKIDIMWYRDNERSFMMDMVTSNYKNITEPSLFNLALDKRSTYKHFSDYSTYSILANHYIKDKTMLDNFLTKELIIKPRKGTLGQGVKKIKKHNIDKFLIQFNNEYSISYSQILLQEFIDTNYGIPGIVNSIHDIRVIIMGKDIPYIIIRTPEGSDFRCNLSQGGGAFFSNIEKLPKKIQDDIQIIKHRIEQLVNNHDMYYAIDICFDYQLQKTYLIEITANMGLGHLNNNVEITTIFLKSFSKFVTANCK